MFYILLLSYPLVCWLLVFYSNNFPSKLNIQISLESCMEIISLVNFLRQQYIVCFWKFKLTFVIDVS